jgi:uncharacterized lipoprotein YbaY
MLRQLYECADGVQLTVLREPDAVRITLNGQIYDLKLAESNQGTANNRYNAGALTWSVVGDIGTLQDATDPAHPALLAKDCRQQSILPPASSAKSIRGTLNFALRKDLPPTAEIRMQLLDLKAPDTPRKTTSVTTFNLRGRQPPVPFELALDSATGHPSDCCALFAEILVDGRPQYATAKPLPIADLMHPGPVTLELQPLHRKAARPGPSP